MLANAAKCIDNSQKHSLTSPVACSEYVRSVCDSVESTLGKTHLYSGHHLVDLCAATSDVQQSCRQGTETATATATGQPLLTSLGICVQISHKMLHVPASASALLVDVVLREQYAIAKWCRRLMHPLQLHSCPFM